MTLLWSTPRQWATNDPITQEKLNEISDQLTYLFSPSTGIATVRGSGANVILTTTVPLPIDTLNYKLSVELTGTRDVQLALNGAAANNTLAALNRFDVLIDGTTYASSLTGTVITNGLVMTAQFVASNFNVVSLRHTIPAGVLAAGIHTFEPVMWSSAGALTWLEASLTSQFKVGEY